MRVLIWVCLAGAIVSLGGLSVSRMRAPKCEPANVAGDAAVYSPDAAGYEEIATSGTVALDCCAWNAEGCSAWPGMWGYGGTCSLSIGVRGHENVPSYQLKLSGGGYLGDTHIHGKTSGLVTVVNAPAASIVFRQDPTSGQIEPEEIARSCRGYLKRWKRK